MSDGEKEVGYDPRLASLGRRVRRGIWHMEHCAFREESGKECDCGCMEAMDALNMLVAERDHYRKAICCALFATGNRPDLIPAILKEALTPNEKDNLPACGSA